MISRPSPFIQLFSIVCSLCLYCTPAYAVAHKHHENVIEKKILNSQGERRVHGELVRLSELKSDKL